MNSQETQPTSVSDNLICNFLHLSLSQKFFRTLNSASAPFTAFFAVFLLLEVAYGSTLTINSSTLTTPPSTSITSIQSGVQFQFQIGFSWSGAPASGTLIIQDDLPSPLLVQSASPAGPLATIPVIDYAHNSVKYTLTGITASAGSGVLSIIVQFPAGTTCPGLTVCDTARIQELGGGTKWVFSAPACISAIASNNWRFNYHGLYAGCAACPGNDIVFLVDVYNPNGTYGGLNLSPVTLNFSFPASSGAVITDVTTSPISHSTVNTAYANQWNSIISTSNPNVVNVTLDPSISLPVTTTTWTLYIHVNFPCGDTGWIRGTGLWRSQTVCPSTAILDTTKDSVKICPAKSIGSLSKIFYEPTYDPYNAYYSPDKITPGCCGTYQISYQNTGTVSQTGLVMTDTIPGFVDVSVITTTMPPPGTPGVWSVKEEVWTHGGTSWTTLLPTPRTSSGVDAIPTSLMPVSKIRWTYTGPPLAVGSNSFSNYIDVCVRATNFKTGAAVVAGQIMIDTVVMHTATSDTLNTCVDTISVTSPHLVAEKAFVGKCSGGTSPGASPNGPWYPGDIVRFRIAVANVGSAATTQTTITDALPAGFTYEGGASYYYGPILPHGTWLTASTPNCDTSFKPTFTQATQGMLGASLISPSPMATNCVWTIPKLPAQCDGTPLYFIIEFNALIDTVPPTLPGSYCNHFTVSAANADPALSDDACLVVSNKSTVIAKKQVRSGTSGTWSSSATIPPGGNGEYLLTVTNTGNISLANLCITDILPHSGDIGVLPPYAARSSALAFPLSAPLTSLPAGFTASYFGGNPLSLAGTVNPKRTEICGGFCSVTNPSGSISGPWQSTFPNYGTYAFSVSAGTSTTLAPGASLQVIVPFTVPANATLGSTACNSFAYQCYPTGSAQTCLAAEPANVCVTVGIDTASAAPCCYCDTIGITPSAYTNLQEQWKTFTIYHLHTCSPITTINLQYIDCATGLPVSNLAYVNGGNAIVYRSSTPAPHTLLPYSSFNISDNYQRLPITGVLPVYGTPPSQNRVSFDLGLNYGVMPSAWCIRVVIHYANGDSCLDSIPSWSPSQPTNGTGWNKASMSGVGRVYVIPIKIDPTQFPKTRLGFATASVADTGDIIIGGSGGIWESQMDSLPTTRPQTFVQNKHTALFRLEPDTNGPFSSSMQFYVFISHSGDTSKKPVLYLGLYDNEANLLSTDTVQASSTVSSVTPPTGAIQPTKDIEIRSIVPNPARTTITVHYVLGANETAKLEMINTLGMTVGVLAEGYQIQGEHIANFIVSQLTGGSYYVRLSTQSGQTTATVKVIH